MGMLAFAIINCSCLADGMAQVKEAVPATAYPDPQCIKPDVNLIKPPKLGDAVGNVYDPADAAAYNAKARRYNSQVKAFNQGSEAYSSCIHKYVDDASREVKRIQDQANADLKRITDSSNATIDAIQAKMKRAVTELNDLAMDQKNSTRSMETRQ